MAQPQSFKNHTRFDPPFHFFVLPALLVNLGLSVYATIHAWPQFVHRDLWWIVMSVVFLVWAGKTRSYDLRNQDRIIRLEEQLRLADLLPESQLDVVETLSIKQFVALRFASDGEVAGLAIRAVNEKLEPKQIKEAIVSWRADNERV